MLQKWTGANTELELPEILSIYDLHSSTCDAAFEVLEKSLKDAARPQDQTSGINLAPVKKSTHQLSRRKRTRKDYLVFASIILVGTTVVGGVEYFVVFGDTRPTTQAPKKEFEVARDQQIIDQQNLIEQLRKKVQQLERERVVLREALRIARQ